MAAAASSIRFSELTKSMMRASSASQFTGVESIVVFLFLDILLSVLSATRIGRRSQSVGGIDLSVLWV